MKQIDLSYIDNGAHNGVNNGFCINSCWPNSNSITTGTLEYVRYGTKWFLSRFVEFRSADINTTTSTTHDLCYHNTLNVQTFIDLAEDLPDANQYTFANSAWNKLNIGSTNYNDYVKIPQSIRDKITAKGWILAI